MSNPQTSDSSELQPDLTAADPYRVLGVSPVADQATIKRTYFALIRKYPPEKDAEAFKIIRRAYEQLKNSRRRAETDILLPKKTSVWTPPSQLPPVDTALHVEDVLWVLRHWGDLGRTDFRDDFGSIEL